MSNSESSLIMEYIDHKEKFRGWFVADGVNYSLCAGGMRVQKDLTLEHLKKLACNMTKKMRICELPIDGAKCGIDYDPASPGKYQAMTRFIGAIKPFLQTRYSMGSDLNTSMKELDEIANSYGLPNVKNAIAIAQGFKVKYFLERYNILYKKAIGNWTLGKLRGGYGVAIAALRVLDHLNIVHHEAVVAIQGFGTLAKASIVGLLKNKVKIKAIADKTRCIIAKNNSYLPVEDWINNEGTLLPHNIDENKYEIRNKEAIYEVDCDILMLEAIENAITERNASSVKAKAIVPGANLAVSEAAEKILFVNGITVLPCFVAGCSASLSMNGLFGCKEHPKPLQVLNYVTYKMNEIVDNVLNECKKSLVTPGVAANMIINKAHIPLRKYPYEF